jgi:hypothetical protein
MEHGTHVLPALFSWLESLSLMGGAANVGVFTADLLIDR